MRDVKLYFGPMSKNVVDSIISFVEKNNIRLGLVASRRQIDYNSGYVNNWTTKTFTQYVRDRSKNIVICRDHSGVGQGTYYDNGLISLLEDAKYMDIIHIDPWKVHHRFFSEGIQYTTEIMRTISSINNSCLFEIGTEESILPMTVKDIEAIITCIKIPYPNLFDKIQYVVIQSGTKLENGMNVGRYNEQRLRDMIDLCLKYNLLSKEHNGDYLSPVQIKNKFNLGLNAINIAPEIVHEETTYLLENLSTKKVDAWYTLCLENSFMWSKWFSKQFDKYDVLSLCGHYVFSHKDFSKICDLDSISIPVSIRIHKFLQERV